MRHGAVNTLWVVVIDGALVSAAIFDDDARHRTDAPNITPTSRADRTPKQRVHPPAGVCQAPVSDN